MSGECDKCGDHALECKCVGCTPNGTEIEVGPIKTYKEIIIIPRKWISKEEALKIWPNKPE